MSNDTQDAPVESSTTNTDVNVDSSTTENSDVNEGSSPSNAVPYERFKEVNDKMKTYREEMDDMKSLLEDLKSQKEPDTFEEPEAPDPIDDPQGYKEYLKEQVISEIDNRTKAQRDKEDSENKAIIAKFNAVRDKHGEYDETQLADFALEYGLTDYMKAYELMQKIGSAKEEGKNEVDYSYMKAKSVPTGDTGSTKSVGLELSQEDLKGMSYDHLLDILKSRSKT